MVKMRSYSRRNSTPQRHRPSESFFTLAVRPLTKMAGASLAPGENGTATCSCPFFWYAFLLWKLIPLRDMSMHGTMSSPNCSERTQAKKLTLARTRERRSVPSIASARLTICSSICCSATDALMIPTFSPSRVTVPRNRVFTSVTHLAGQNGCCDGTNSMGTPLTKPLSHSVHSFMPICSLGI
jgi:hypothetical protein